MGIDIVLVERIRAFIERSGGRFIDEWFSADEIAYCASKAHPHRHYAARLAAKEATVKALEPAWDGPVLLRNISITVTESGAPRILLSGRAAEIARTAGITALHVSLSHCREYAVASVIAER